MHGRHIRRLRPSHHAAEAWDEQGSGVAPARGDGTSLWGMTSRRPTHGTVCTSRDGLPRAWHDGATMSDHDVRRGRQEETP
jgi:hypothetical protein